MNKISNWRWILNAVSFKYITYTEDKWTEKWIFTPLTISILLGFVFLFLYIFNAYTPLCIILYMLVVYDHSLSAMWRCCTMHSNELNNSNTKHQQYWRRKNTIASSSFATQCNTVLAYIYKNLLWYYVFSTFKYIFINVYIHYHCCELLVRDSVRILKSKI